MKIPLQIAIALIFFILIAGCFNQPSTSGNPAPAVATDQTTASPASVFPESSKFTTLIMVTGQSGKTSDSFLYREVTGSSGIRPIHSLPGDRIRSQLQGRTLPFFRLSRFRSLTKIPGRSWKRWNPREDLTKPSGLNQVWIPGHGNRNSTREIKSIILWFRHDT